MSSTTTIKPLICPRAGWFREEAVKRVNAYLASPPFDRITRGKAVIERMDAPRESVIEVPDAFRWAHDHRMWVVIEPGDSGLSQGDIVQCVAEPGFGGGAMEFDGWKPEGVVSFLGSAGGGLLKVNMAAQPVWRPEPLTDTITATLQPDDTLKPFGNLVFLEYDLVGDKNGVLLTAKTQEVDMVATVVAGDGWEPGTRVIADQGSVVRRVTRDEREVWAHHPEGIFCEVTE